MATSNRVTFGYNQHNTNNENEQAASASASAASRFHQTENEDEDIDPIANSNSNSTLRTSDILLIFATVILVCVTGFVAVPIAIITGLTVYVINRLGGATARRSRGVAGQQVIGAKEIRDPQHLPLNDARDTARWDAQLRAENRVRRADFRRREIEMRRVDQRLEQWREAERIRHQYWFGTVHGGDGLRRFGTRREVREGEADDYVDVPWCGTRGGL